MTTALTLDNVINGLNVGGTLNVSGLGVLAPDQSLGSLTVTAVGLSSAPTETSFTSSVTIQGAYGTLVMQADGSYSYTASSNISFTNTNGYVQDSFVFTAGNSSGAGQATLTITVTPSGVQYVGAAAGSTVTVGNAATVVDASLGNVTVNAGNGNDTFILGTGDKLTAGNGTDTVAASTATNASITLGNGNDTVLAGSGDQVTLGNGNDTVTAGSGDTIAVGNGNDTVTAASSDQITLGNGADTVAVASNDQIKVGNGTDTVTAASSDQITLGNGTDTVTAASNDQISLGNGTDTVTAGINSAVTAGNGTDTVTVGMDSSVTLGNGTDTVKAGNDTTVSVGNGSDTITDGTGSTVTAGNGTDTITTGIGSTDTVGNGSDTISTGVDSTVTQKATTTGTAATVLNLNLLDSDGSNDTGGTEIVTLQEVASALFPATTTPQLATLAKSFWNNQLLVTFQAGPSSYYTLWGTSTGYFSIATSDQHGNLTGPVVSNSSAVSSSSVFLAAIANLQLAGLTSSSLLVGTEVQNLTGTNVVHGLANNPGISNILQSGPGADVLVGGSAPDTFAYATSKDSPFSALPNPAAPSGPPWDVITTFKPGTDTLDFTGLLNDPAVVQSGGMTATKAGLAQFIWLGQQPTGTTSVSQGYSVWYTPDQNSNNGIYVYVDTNGDGQADVKIDVAGVSALTYSNFAGVDPPSAFTVTINPIESSQANQWLVNSADAHVASGLTVTGTTTHFNSAGTLIVTFNGHNYTATVQSNGNWSANIPSSALLATADGTYTLSAAVKVGSSTQATASHAVTVDETAPTVSWAASTPGAENIPITLGNLSASDPAIPGSGPDPIASLMVSGIPIGATLTDGTPADTFTASSGHTSVDVHAWNLSNLKITTSSDTNFTLSAVATDTSGNSSTTVTELVSVIDPGPTATNDTGATNEDTVLTVSAANGVLANDHPDDAGDTISVTAINGVAASVGQQITLGSGAHLTLNANGSYVCDPTSSTAFETIQIGHTAVDTFTYTITDNAGASATATVRINVSVTDSGPTASAVTASTNEDASVLVTASAHGEDSGDTITAWSAGAASAHGATITNNNNGTFTYNPNGAAFFETLANGASATDTFSYTVTDNHGVTASATATVTVSVTDSGPTASAVTASTNEDASVLSIITGGGKWVEIAIAADCLYQHLLLTAEKKFWRCVESGEPPRLFGAEPPRPRIEAVRIVDMSSSNSWAEFAGVFRQTRMAFLQHENAKTELKGLVPEDAKEATGHGLRAKRSKSGAISFDLLEVEAGHAALQ